MAAIPAVQLAWPAPCLDLRPPPASRAEEPKKLALLVGIDRYAPGTPDSFQNLSGCVRDVVLVRAVLEDRFGFQSEDILVLADEAATHAAIVGAFREHLVGRAGPETEVVFWFSGHGSRVPDQSGASAAEIGGKDSTFVAYDSRAGGENGAFDVSDDEVRSLLAALTAKTRRVMVVTDSCHSGGATRSGRAASAPRYRGVDGGARPVDRERLLSGFWPQDVQLLDDGDRAMLEPPAYVHIAACAPTQLAQEIDAEGDDGRPQSHGALTFFLVQRLRAAQPSVSYRRLADDVAVDLSTRCPAQTAWAEGALSREVLGARFEPRPSGFRARATAPRATASAAGPGELRIEAGSVHGLRTGSVLAIYAGTELVGRASVARAHAVASTASWLDPAPKEPPAGALRAVEETRPAREEPLSLYVGDGQAAGGIDAELRARISKSQRVRLEDDSARAEYHLRAEADGRLVFLGPGDLVLWKEAQPPPRDGAALLEGLESEFREELRYRALVALARDRGTLEIEARFLPPTEEELDEFRKKGRYELCADARPRAEAGAQGSASGSVYRAVGTRDADSALSLAVLEVENRAGSPVHVAVLSVSEDRLRNAIWPPEGERDRVLEKGERVRVPVNVVSNPAWREARPMRDRYLVLATLEPADFTPLAREEITRGEVAPLKMPPLLALAVEQPQTRGLRQASTDRAGWGLAVVDLYVDPPPGR